MKKILSLLFVIIFLSYSSAQNISFETLLNDKISIRAIQIWKGTVWYSGTESKFGFVSLKDTLHKKQIKLSEKKLQFRTLAQDRNAFYVINIESPAQFFRIDKKTLSFKIIHTDSDQNAFYDALKFNNGMFYTFSDPNPDLNLKFVSFNTYKEQFISKKYSTPKLKEGEAAFAASNTNIAATQDYVWLATGGKASRIFRLNLISQKMEVFETPFIQGTSSQGMYSIDFTDDNFGIAVGGDYTKPGDNLNNIATTNDGGKTWQIQASGKNSGYKTCVKIRPGSKGKEIIAVGDQNIEFSKDFGKTWTKISDEKGLFVCEWINKKTLVFAGKDRIVKMKF